VLAYFSSKIKTIFKRLFSFYSQTIIIVFQFSRGNASIFELETLALCNRMDVDAKPVACALFLLTFEATHVCKSKSVRIL
jgi:hypothetical protein